MRLIFKAASGFPAPDLYTGQAWSFILTKRQGLCSGRTRVLVIVPGLCPGVRSDPVGPIFAPAIRGLLLGKTGRML